METRHRTGGLRGLAAGLAVACFILLLARLNSAVESELLRTIVNFFVSLPTLVFQGLPPLLQQALFFLYWALAGWAVGVLSEKPGARMRLFLLLVVSGLSAAHVAAQIKLERDFGAMLGAVAEALQQRIGGHRP